MLIRATTDSLQTTASVGALQKATTLIEHAHIRHMCENGFDAEVQSLQECYRVFARNVLEKDRLDTICSCLDARAGRCKHICAALVKCMRTQGRISPLPETSSIPVMPSWMRDAYGTNLRESGGGSGSDQQDCKGKHHEFDQAFTSIMKQVLDMTSTECTNRLVNLLSSHSQETNHFVRILCGDPKPTDDTRGAITLKQDVLQLCTRATTSELQWWLVRATMHVHTHNAVER